MKNPESRLVSCIKKEIESKYPRAIVIKLADRYTRGLPDLLVIGATPTGLPSVLMLEAKTPDGEQAAIQRAFEQRVALISVFCPSIRYRVVRSIKEAREAICQHGLM